MSKFEIKMYPFSKLITTQFPELRECAAELYLTLSIPLDYTYSIFRV